MADLKPVGKKKKGRWAELGIVLVLVGAVVAGGFYQEEISNFFRLKLWDKEAPARVVSEFLQAGKVGDQKKAKSYLATDSFQPLRKGGKWVGYFFTMRGTKTNFIFNELMPSSGPDIRETKFITSGAPIAEVSARDFRKKPFTYELEMRDGEWKITSMHP